MWAAFVDYRLNPKTKAMSEKNRENRSKLKMPHTCGSKSMARKKQEMELASGKPVSRGAVFVATHKRKDGSYVNDNAKIVSLSEMDSLGQVLGKENLGRVCGLGFGPSPTQVFGHATTRLGRIPLNGGSDHAGDNLGLESVPPEFADLINPQVHKLLDGLVSRTLGYLAF
ncbi:uncharacterized protein G2W53_040306 [Senna tora]|uniref:Uncharacterized protein n=1 Tax=Senna tora TaxID=362788 RepID=A0A834W3L7_9FABA|nr:uncharacterized protein G2W53_040306 [Senna tora]